MPEYANDISRSCDFLFGSSVSRAHTHCGKRNSLGLSPVPFLSPSRLFDNTPPGRQHHHNGPRSVSLLLPISSITRNGHTGFTLDCSRAPDCHIAGVVEFCIFKNSKTNHPWLYSKKHQKRLSAPSHWLLDKMSGTYAPKASPGPHKLRDCLPLIVFIRNRYDSIPRQRGQPSCGTRTLTFPVE